MCWILQDIYLRFYAFHRILAVYVVVYKILPHQMISLNEYKMHDQMLYKSAFTGQKKDDEKYITIDIV